MILGYLGPKYTFSYKAAKLYCEQHFNVQLTEEPANSFYALFNRLDLDDWNLQHFNKIIVPIENSIEGSINENFDLLKSTLEEHPYLGIEAEIVLPIQECLIGCDVQDKAQITDILSHPQPLAHCRHYLEKNYAQATKFETLSTTAAALIALAKTSGYKATRDQLLAYAADQAHGLAVIGDAELVNIDPTRLTILDKNISDHPTNATRFLVIGREQMEFKLGDKFKTSIIVSGKKDIPGSLYNILGEFAGREINLTKIESRPTKEVLGDYLFFIDFLGHLSENKIQEALQAIEAQASYFKLLGSYKIL